MENNLSQLADKYIFDIGSAKEYCFYDTETGDLLFKFTEVKGESELYEEDKCIKLM